MNELLERLMRIETYLAANLERRAVQDWSNADGGGDPGEVPVRGSGMVR